MKNIIVGIVLIFVTNFSYGQKLKGSLSNAISINNHDILVGSGLMYLKDSNIYLVTAAHVLFKVDSIGHIMDDLRYAKITIKSYSETQYDQFYSVVKVALKQGANVRKHREKDICIVKIGSIIGNTSNSNISVFTDNNSIIIKSIGSINSFNKSKTVDFKDIEQGNDIRIIGYPKSLDFYKNNDKHFFNFNYPLVQNGIVSGINESDGYIITNAPVYRGNSGGAVLYKVESVKLENTKLLFTQDYLLIGIVTDYIPFIIDTKNKNDKYDISNSGYSVVVPIQYAIGLMNY